VTPPLPDGRVAAGGEAPPCLAEKVGLALGGEVGRGVRADHGRFTSVSMFLM